MKPDPASKMAEKEELVRHEVLREAVFAGEQSGIAEGNVMEEIRERMRRRALASPPRR